MLKNGLIKRDFYAIGEIGMDLYWDKSFLTQQQEAFRTTNTMGKRKKITY